MKNKRKIAIEILINNSITIILLIITAILKLKNNLIYGNNDTVFSLFIFPILALFITFLFIIASQLEKSSLLSNKFVYHTLNMNIVLVLNITQVLILLRNGIENFNLPTRVIMNFAIGLCIAFFGNNLPRLKEGSWLQVLSWMFKNNKSKWRRFTRTSGYVWTIVGLIIMALAMIDSIITTFTIISIIIATGVFLVINAITLLRNNKCSK